MIPRTAQSLTFESWGPLAGGAPQQLVVICHGVGATGQAVIGLAAEWGKALPHALFVAPDAPHPHDMAMEEPGNPNRQWFSLADRTPHVLQAGAALATPYLDRFISETLAAQNLPPDAYALVGFSQGAMMVLYAGLRRQPAPRGILAYAGAMLAPPAAEPINTMPVLIVHGEADEVVLPDRSRESARLLRARGLDVETLFLPDIGHWIEENGISAGRRMLQRIFHTDSLALGG